jgi:hypothetical protein
MDVVPEPLVAALGAVTVALVVYDVTAAVLAPVRRGPLERLISRSVFEVLRRVAIATRAGVLSAAGPSAVVLTIVAWVVLAAFGFALVLLPVVDDLSLQSSVSYGDRDLLLALYFSGTALTSVGFGDVVAATDLLRVLSIAEAATGFAVLTGGITYVLSLYPRVSLIRSGARSVQSQAADSSRAAAVVADGGPSYLIALHQQVLEVDEQIQRFPVLFFFHSEDRSASLHTLLRGAGMVCVQARWGVDPGKAPWGRTLGTELQQTLDQLVEHYGQRFMVGHGPAALDGPLAEDEARRRLSSFVTAAGAAGAAGATSVLEDEGELSRFARFAGRYETFLDHVANQHLKPQDPLR